MNETFLQTRFWVRVIILLSFTGDTNDHSYQKPARHSSIGKKFVVTIKNPILNFLDCAPVPR